MAIEQRLAEIIRRSRRAVLHRQSRHRAAGHILIDQQTVTVRIDRRAYSPVLPQADLPAGTTVPWWHGRRLHFEFAWPSAELLAWKSAFDGNDQE